MQHTWEMLALALAWMIFARLWKAQIAFSRGVMARVSERWPQRGIFGAKHS